MASVTSHNKGAYFEADLRSVRQEGVDHVMGVLMDTLVVRAGEAPPVPEPEASPEINENILKDIEKAASVVCDEELIESN